MHHFPFELRDSVFFYLSVPELAQTSLVCKLWFQDSNRKLQKISQAIAFGKAQWHALGIDIGEDPVPPLPKHVYQWLHSPCDFWPNKQRIATGRLFLLPKYVNAIHSGSVDISKKTPTTILSVGKLMHRHFPPILAKCGYRKLDARIEQELGNKSVRRHAWVWITFDLLPESRGLSYEEQRTCVSAYQVNGKTVYEIPSLLEVVTAVFLHCTCTRERLLSTDDQNERIFTRCRDLFDNGNSIPAVGGFTFQGLSMMNGDGDRSNMGILAKRTFEF